MSEEKIAVEITDRIDNAVVTKLTSIRTQAQLGAAAITRLQETLSQLNGPAESVARLANAQARLTNANSNAALTQQRLVTEQARGTVVQQQLTNAQTAGAIAAQRLATAQAQTAVQTANAANAASRAATSALRLQQAQNATGTATQGASSAMGVWLTRLASVELIRRTASAVFELADDYTTLQNKLKIVSDSQQQQAELSERLFQIANKTRSPVLETATSYARLDNSLRLLGVSQNQTLRLQETLNKLFVIGGATTQEQSAALLQLSQAFNSGKLQGDEFRSLMENMPRQVRTAIADALGASEANLKKLSSEGKITAEVLLKAFSSLDKFADSKFAETVPTLTQQLTVLKNTFIQLTGEINKQSGATARLSSILGGAADLLQKIREPLMVLSTIEKAAFEFLVTAGEQIGIKIKNILVDIYNSLGEYITNSINKILGGINILRERVGLAPLDLIQFDKLQKTGEEKFKTMGQLWAEALRKGAQDSGLALFLGVKAAQQEGGHSALRPTGPNQLDQGFTKQDLDQLENNLKALDIGIQNRFRSAANSDMNRIEHEAKAELEKNFEQRLKVIRAANDVAKEELRIYEQVSKTRNQFADSLKAIDRLQREGQLSPGEKAGAVNDAAKKAGIDLNGTKLFADAQIEQYKQMYEAIDALRKKDLVSEKEATQLRLGVQAQAFAQQTANLSKALSGVASLSSSGNEKLFKVGKAAAIANAGIQGASAVMNALATPPWYVGVALAIGAAAQVASQIAQIKNMQFSKGYRSGGWTGSGPEDQPAGVTHGQEFVMNASATRRLGVGALQALQSGAASLNQPVTNVTGVNVKIENYGTSKSFEVKQYSADDIRIIARDEAREQVAKESPRVISSQLANPNSKVSKAFASNVVAQRKR